MFKEAREFTVKRSGWDRGRFPVGRSDGMLLGDNGRCCLGFYMNACGVADEDIEGVPVPTEMFSSDDNDEFMPDWLADNEGTIANVNDSDAITEEDRESEITSLFKDFGSVRVKFVD